MTEVTRICLKVSCGFGSLLERSATAPSRAQLMPTAHNITAFYQELIIAII